MKTDWKRLKVSVWQNKQVYLMMLPVLVVLLLFSYYPMYGLVLAFKEYQPAQGIFGSEWVGFQHFLDIFALPDFARAFRNTIVISTLSLIFCFPAPFCWLCYSMRCATSRINDLSKPVSISRILSLGSFWRAS